LFEELLDAVINTVDFTKNVASLPEVGKGKTRRKYAVLLQRDGCNNFYLYLFSGKKSRLWRKIFGAWFISWWPLVKKSKRIWFDLQTVAAKDCRSHISAHKMRKIRKNGADISRKFLFSHIISSHNLGLQCPHFLNFSCKTGNVYVLYVSQLTYLSKTLLNCYHL